MNHSISALLVCALWLTMIACQFYGELIGAHCQADSECHSEVCREGQCTQGCKTDEDCPGPTICVAFENEEGAWCQLACWDSEDCYHGQWCYWWFGAWDGICLPEKE